MRSRVVGNFIPSDFRCLVRAFTSHSIGGRAVFPAIERKILAGKRNCPYNRRSRNAISVLRKRKAAGASRDDRLWTSEGRPLAHRDSRAIGFDHLADGNSGGDNSPGLRAGGQWDVAGVRAGNVRDLSRGAVREQIRALLGFARVALFVRGDGPAAVARRDHRVEPAARLRRDGIERDRRLLSLRKHPTPRCDGARHVDRLPGAAGDRRFDVDRLARRENLGATDAMDRNRLRILDSAGGDARPGAAWLAHRPGATPICAA